LVLRERVVDTAMLLSIDQASRAVVQRPSITPLHMDNPTNIRMFRGIRRARLGKRDRLR